MSFAGNDAFDPAAQVHIRPVRPDDAAAVDQFIRALSLKSRQRRFHAGIRELSPAALARFTSPDHRHEHVLIATVVSRGQLRCIGEARHAVDPQAPGAREFAIVIADGWQLRGLGRRLLCRLMIDALDQGIGTLYGDVLRDNLPMLALATSLGFSTRRHPTDPGLMRVVRALDTRVASLPCPCADRFEPLPVAA